MARYNQTRYQYETSPRKLQPVYEPFKKKYPKKATTKKQDNNLNKNKLKANVQSKKQGVSNFNTKIILYIGIIFVILFAVSYRNALIAQEYSEIKSLKSELAEIEKENKQLEVNIESKTNLGAIEEKAKTELGLKKLNDSQIVYVSLDKQDYVESSEEEVKLEEDLNWLKSIINKIKDIF